MVIDFREFPVVGEDFNIVVIDLMMYEKNQYTPMISYLMANEEKQEYDGGMTLMTGMSFDSYENAAKCLGMLIECGLFLAPVSSTGTVYTNNGEEIEEINWEHLSELNVTPTPQSKPIFH